MTATLATRDASDIVEILRFLSGYVANRAASIERIRRVLHEGLVTATGRNLFAGRFSYLNMSSLTPAQVFDETLATLFNAPAGGVLHVENLKGAAGEVAVRVGDNDPFGVINIGDDAKLVKLCEEKGLNVAEREFAGSLFQELGQPHSTINVLIGLSKGRGLGFFEAGNFHPDFILWQVVADRQQVAFVDPKGIRNVGLSDPKISFHQTVKEIEQRLGDPKVVLDSFIVSNTPSHVMRKQWGIEKRKMSKRHILFQDEDKDSYIGAMFRA